MKKLFLGLAMVITLGTGSARAAGSFEGEVDYHMTNKTNHKMDMNYFLKGKKLRMETQGVNKNNGFGVILMDLTTKKMLMLMSKNKMYMESNIPESKSESKIEGTWSKTGNSQIILGHKTEEWLFTGKKGKASVWAASGMGNFIQSQGKPGTVEVWAEAIRSKGLFPLKMTFTDNSGNVDTTMMATKVEKKSLDDSLFAPPSDYKKMDMGNLFGGSSNQSGDAGKSENKGPLSGVKPKLPF